MCEADGRDVEGVFEGFDGSDHAGIFALYEVAGRIRLAVDSEILGIVVEFGDRGKDATVAKRHAVETGVVRCGVDEGFEGRAGGTRRDRVIELRTAIVAATDEGKNLASVRIDGNESNLGIGDGSRWLAFGGAVQFSYKLVHIFHASVNGLRGRTLEVGVE